MKTVFILIIINVAVYFFIQPSLGENLNEFALSGNGVKNLKIWQLVTYMFLHSPRDFSHILFNMWGLYLFGSIVAPEMGSKRFLWLYFLSGITGSLCWLVFNWSTGYQLIGASGAVFGVMMATAMLYPNLEFIVFPIFIPMKVKTLVVIFAIIEIVSNLKFDFVAHLAHLGGLFAAYFYIKTVYRGRAWDMFAFLKSGNRPSSKGWNLNKQRPPRSPDFGSPGAEPAKKELDRILDKISISGINSLTEDEMNCLRKAREHMKSRNR
jgi:membrane associated rhomboid family serine protease